jgi:hypothetical protein
MAYYLSEVFDDEARIRSLDKSNMRGVLERFPELCEDAITLGRSVHIPRRVKVNNGPLITYVPPEKIVVVGMEGSAISHKWRPPQRLATRQISSTHRGEHGIPLAQIRGTRHPGHGGKLLW